LRQRRYWGKLIGTAGGWFFFDITFYGNALFQPTVLAAVFNVEKGAEGGAPPVTGDLAHNLCAQMAVVGAIGLPGYYVAVWLMDSMGRRRIQMQGFLLMAITFATLGLAYEQLELSAAGRIAMLFLYGLTFFFSNFGPNSTTFILPSETFPQEVRSTLNGFSAACGKLGATIGSSSFKPLKDALTNSYGEAAGLRWTMIACACVALAGFLVTFIFVEDRRGIAMSGGGPVGGSNSMDREAIEDGDGDGDVESGARPDDASASLITSTDLDDEESSTVGPEARIRRSEAK